jgi:myo-inositol-1(or 4)-monophosphatase
MHPLINIAFQAARSASKYIVRALDRLDNLTINEKQRNDFVTDIDKQSEQEIIHHIQKAYPDHAIICEECGSLCTKPSDYTWIIDPLDGTANFIHGYPHFAISIAVKHKSGIEHGLIYDPVRQELFTATRGDGAFMNDRRIRVSKRPTFHGTLIGTGFGHGHPENLPTHMKIFSNIMPQVAGIRRSGSAALDFAYVAAGRIDGFWEFNLAAWDIAAGSLLVREAGGFVSDIDGKDTFLESGNVVAGNPKVYQLLLNEMKK